MTEEKRIIEGFLLKENGMAQFVKIEDSLKVYYDLLDCDCIDMCSRTIGGLRYEFVVDDNGLLTERKPTVFDIHGKPHLVGSVFVCLIDDAGECQSLTKAHCVNLMTYLFAGLGPDGTRIVLTGVDY